MKKISEGQKRLIAESLANIGVAWFAGGVISLFVGMIKDPWSIVFSLSWGILFSLFFIFAGTYLLRGINHDF